MRVCVCVFFISIRGKLRTLILKTPPILKIPPGVCYLGGWVKGRLFSNRGKGLNRFLFLISKSMKIIFK